VQIPVQFWKLLSLTNHMAGNNTTHSENSIFGITVLSQKFVRLSARATITTQFSKATPFLDGISLHQYELF
jgi:hypothetical protein